MIEYNSRNSFQATTFKAKDNSRTFQGLAQQFKDFQDCANPVKVNWELTTQVINGLPGLQTLMSACEIITHG